MKIYINNEEYMSLLNFTSELYKVVKIAVNEDLDKQQRNKYDKELFYSLGGYDLALEKVKQELLKSGSYLVKTNEKDYLFKIER